MTVVEAAPILPTGPSTLTTETDLVRILVRHLRADWPTRAIGTEVKSHGRCRTDVCVRVRDPYASADSDLLLGVEAKLANWTRVLQQAVLNSYAVDASLIAMPAQRVNDELLDLAAKHGIGVLAVHARGLNVTLRARVGSPDAALRARMTAQLEPAKMRGGLRVGDLVRGS